MTKKQWDTLWLNACVVTCAENNHVITNGAVAIKDGSIAWVGSCDQLTESAEKLAETVHDVSGCCVTPGLIDCHTHLVFAGNRAHEFEQRLHGATYAEIAQKGGGIQSTVAATRAASEQDLFTQSLARAKSLMQSGVTTLEIKSGYGLDLATELKMLRVAKRIAESLALTVKTTFLGAHTTPPEYRNRHDEYVDLVCNEMLPRIAAEKLADAVDVFCETIAFTHAQTERIFKAAKQHGLAIKCHAEQLSDSDSAKLAASYQALSADHLEHVSLAGIQAMAAAGTVAVLLPGAFYFLREAKMPPVELLRQYRVPMAIASDCNPGTSPVLSLSLMLNFACTLYRLTPDEAFAGVTRHAARALGIEQQYGSLEVGKVADLAIWNVTSPIELVYYIGSTPLRQLVKAGKVIYT